LLAYGRWFSPGTLASSTTKTGRHDIAEMLLKVAWNTKNQIKSIKLKTKEPNSIKKKLMLHHEKLETLQLISMVIRK
jgi:hypothetical protein